MTFLRAALGAGLLAYAGLSGAQVAKQKTYIVQLDAAPAASYAGTVSGLAATRPAPGAKLDVAAPNVRAYLSYLDQRRSAVLARAGAVKPLQQYSVAFNGFAAKMSDAQAQALAQSSGVVSVVESEIRKLDTTRTPAFLGLSTPGGLWSQLDAASRNIKGEDVIIGVIDSGVWPENASYGDKVDATGKPVAYNGSGTSVYGPPPAKWKGACVAGPGFTAAMCNNKLIGARYYIDGFNAGGATLIPLEYASPRDGGGHGTHTSTTAGGNENVDATVNGVPIGAISGIAPRARIAAYKICWEATVTTQTGCYTSDTLKAIDDAVADGVDVINFSVSGTQTNFVDPVEIAYLNASTAGVFVAASAGNSGPGNEVAHMSPWLTTVAASTHDRSLVANLTLGNGAVYTGASFNTVAVPSAPLVLSTSAGGAGVPAANVNLCFLNSLDPAKVTGKIVVCDRGTNDRVEKSAEVKRAGGVGMVMINPSPNTLVADFHSVPTVHLPDTVRDAVRAYAATAGATGSIGVYYQASGVIAPVMASFSSRGPNKANGNILKPDISGPGVDIFAGYIAGLSQTQHDALVLGGFTPPPNAQSLQGTSMSSPHVAGAAALIKQAHPTWSPAAIKSALMTSTNDILLANGSVDPDRWGYGAGHLNPTPAANPGLVYDAGSTDYGRFLCGLALTPPSSIGSCSTLGTLAAYNLNLASLTASDVAGTVTFNRRVTNVSGSTATYLATATLPGWNVTVSPASLTLANGASANFTVALVNTSSQVGAWTFGSLVWSDGVHRVRSPLSARAQGFIAPAEVSDVRASGKGSKVYSMVSGYTGTLGVSASGLVAATRTTGIVGAGATQCSDFSVGAGNQLARFQLFNADTQGGSATDIDLTVFRGPGGTGAQVGASLGTSSDEVVTVAVPAAGTYSACVSGFAVPTGGAAYTLSSWVVGAPAAGQSLKASGPANVYAGGAASIGLGWAVTPGARYLGNVRYLDSANTQIGSTIVFVDNH